MVFSRWRGILFCGKNLVFRKENFKELLNKTLWKTVHKNKGQEESWQIFKDSFHRTQQLGIPRHKEWGKEGTGTGGWGLLVKLKGKN